jgi:hypothetical protein
MNIFEEIVDLMLQIELSLKSGGFHINFNHKRFLTRDRQTVNIKNPGRYRKIHR